MQYSSTQIERQKMSKKDFYVTSNVGKAKYVVSFHDGVQAHDDGSPFYDIKICSTKRALNSFIHKLLREGY